MGMVKDLLYQGLESSFDYQLQSEAFAASHTDEDGDCQEAALAFLEKRPLCSRVDSLVQRLGAGRRSGCTGVCCSGKKGWTRDGRMIEAMRRRVSVRAYADRPVEEGAKEKIRGLLDVHNKGPFGNRVRFA